MNLSAPKPSPLILGSSAGRARHTLEAALVHVPRGVSRAPASERHRIGIHFGPPVNAECSVGGLRMRRLQKHGDIDFVPAGVDGVWEDDADCRILRLGFHASLLEQVAGELGRDSAKIEFLPRLQIRDARIEAIGWAIKADLDADTPSDPLYVDLLANALAVRLIEIATARRHHAEGSDGPRLSARQLSMLTEFIEANLDQKLFLADLAATAGISSTRLKSLFRNSTGSSVHQYVIRRRIEYARGLIATTAMPISEIALATGFAHQSHMASTMRRVLGQTPGEIAGPSRKFRPKLQGSA